MAEIVSLGRIRKARVRTAAKAQAAANGVAHGRTKAQRQADRDATARRDRDLDGSKRDR